MTIRSRTARAFGIALAITLVACASASGGGEPAGTSWTTWGASPDRVGLAATDSGKIARSFVLPLDGRITNQVLYADGSFFVATSAGKIVSFTPSGIVRWQVDVGQISSKCAQLDGYGVTGTGVIDTASSTLYEMDAFGRLHALSLATGAERKGWPVQLFTDSTDELDWGALTLADGSVYVPTASYCDTPGTPGAVYRVNTATRAVHRWLSVPITSGGGGGAWGWGGLAFDPTLGKLFAATSGAFTGGTNTGSSFSEFVGHGDQLVEFAPNLTVAAGSHPADLPDRMDLDFVGSPVVVDRPGCGPLVGVADKDDTVYVWRAGSLAAGPVAEIPIQTYDIGNPMLAQLAWSPALNSFYTATGTQLVRISVSATCAAKLVWRVPLGTQTENGSPTISGNDVWITVNGKPTLDAYDAATGKRLSRTPLGGTTLTAPTIVDNRLVIGTFTGLVEGFSFSGSSRALAAAHTSSSSVSAVSWAGVDDAWESRTNGVYATENAGRTWHEIYEEPALSLLRLSASAGVIQLGIAPGPCMCVTRKLWTADDGKTWHVTDAIGTDYVGADRHLYWWQGGDLHIISDFPPPDGAGKALDAKLAVALPDGTIVGAARTPDGFAFLVSNRVEGQQWDTDPRVIVAGGSNVQTVRLPSAPAGDVLVERISAEGANLTVTGENFGAVPVTAVTWTSADGGLTWNLGA